MKRIFNKIVSMVANLSLVVSTLVPLATPVPAYASTAWGVGDVFAGVAGGSYKVYDNSGAFKETISDGLGGFTTGCAFNGALDKLYTTNFSNTKVVVYNNASPHTIAQTVDTNAINAAGHSESVVFAANGDFYVGHPDGNDDIQRYNSAGVYQQSYNVAIESRGSDWMDLAVNQTTMFYTSEGRLIKKYDVSGAGAQLADFATLPAAEGPHAYALRLLPPGDGSGGLLVADTNSVKRLNGLGVVVQTYDAPGENQWFALNLDPNGTSFWSGDLTSANFYRFNIASGAIEVGPINTGTGFNTLAGICLKGEPTAAGEDTRRMTGGGTIPAGNPTLEGKHGFELHCDVADLPNRLEVNWGKGNKFHLESLTSAVCVDDPFLDEEQPVAGFDTYKGKGTGRLNGVSGATAEWTFTDDGEPGVDDYATITITYGVNTYTFSGNLKNGNHQAHAQ